MVRYQLRAEDPRRDDAWAPRTLLWHVTRAGAAFAVCARRLQPATGVRPIQDADCVPVAQRCALCWQLAFEDLPLPT